MATLEPEDIRRVKCPTCNVDAGEPCRTMIGNLPMRLGHVLRERHAKRLLRRENGIRSALRRGA